MKSEHLTRIAIGLTVVLALAGAVALAAQPPKEVIIASYATNLQGRTDNQRHNAQLSLQKLNGAVVKPGETFSFTDYVGTWSRDTGYRRAPVSYNGTLIDAWGGGVCQTSTTLYNTALLAGMEIVERHPHRFAPSYAPPGRDAAVAFSSIDLKFRNPHPYEVRIEGGFKGNQLVVSIYGAEPLKERPRLVTDVQQLVKPREYRMDKGGPSGRIRNNGKAGYEVATYRLTGGKKEMLSMDNYPPMHRIVEYR